ncbi:hypothetical protein TNCV_1141341 [Trichonephila clavipes]|nr:hypothetical protein TNCV_1141341 [Trichonephila clavipes]
MDSRKPFSPTISGSNTIRYPSPTLSSGVIIIIVTSQMPLKTTRKGAMHVKYVETKRPAIDVVCKLDEDVPRYHPRLLTMVKNHEVCHQ